MRALIEVIVSLSRSIVRMARTLGNVRHHIRLHVRLKGVRLPVGIEVLCLYLPNCGSFLTSGVVIVGHFCVL